jgi:uncharacterized membrane protein
MSDTKPLPAENSRIRTGFILVCLIMLLAGALRLQGIGAKSLWIDELKALEISGKSVTSIINYASYGSTPPLRYLIIKALMVFPQEAFWTRLPSLLAALATIPLLIALGTKLIGKAPGLWTALLLAVSPWHIIHSQDNRMYTIITFLALWALYFALQAIDNPKKLTAWAGFIIISTINMYLSYFALWTLFTTSLLLLLIIIRQSRHYDVAIRTLTKHRITGSLISLLLIIILYIPWMPPTLRYIFKFGPDHAAALMIHNETGTIGLASLLPVSSAFAAEQDYLLSQPGQRWRPAGTKFNFQFFNTLLGKLSVESRVRYSYLLLFIAGILICFNTNKNRTAIIIVGWLIIPIMVCILPPPKGVFHIRYLFYILPLFLFGVAFALDWITVFVKKYSASLFPISIIILGVIFSCLPAKEIYSILKNEKQDWKNAAAYLEQNMNSGDALITGDQWTHLGVKYYTDMSRSRRRVELIAECFNMNDLRTEVYRPRNGDIWYIHWSPLIGPVKELIEKEFRVQATLPGVQGTIYIMKKGPSNS